jgi:hypothetical protein
MHKQLKIMSNIIKSAVVDENIKQYSRITGIDSTYLTGQGVLFTINSSVKNNRWGNVDFNVVMPTLPDLPPLPVIAQVDNNFNDLEIHETVNQAIESASQGYERAIEVMRTSRDEHRYLQDKQRGLSYDLRDLERENKDLRYQLHHASENDKKELKDELKEIERRKKAIEIERKALMQKTLKLNEKQQKKQGQRLKDRKAYYDGLTTSLVETLCLYSNGLKALPKNESISIIVKSGGGKAERRYKDQIFVFSKKDIRDCSNDTISTTKLLKKAQVYEL